MFIGQFLQWFTLSAYVVLVGFCFCDGFKLAFWRKLVWFVFFVIVSVSVYETYGQFILALILPLPTLLALALCWFQLRSKRI